jgi:hypothetical protein
MQYFVSMFSGQAQLRHGDNFRYGDHAWTTVQDGLAEHLSTQAEGQVGRQLIRPGPGRVSVPRWS